MLRKAYSLFLIPIAMLAGGCGQKSAAPPAAVSTISASSVSVSQIPRLQSTLATSLISSRGKQNPMMAKSLDDEMQNAQQLVKQNPSDVSSLNQLAYIYIRKVRQTVDFSFNGSAEKLLRQALAIDPQNYDSWLYLSIVYMAQHNFADARASASKAISVNDSGSGAYGILGDACYELGLYDQAADAYDKMGDLRPGSPYYARAASYRALTGDPSGAIEIMGEAFEASDPQDLEDHAWYLLQLGNLSFDSGKLSQAEKFYRQSLEFFPASYNALAGLAKVSFAEGKSEEAIALYQKAIAIVPMPDFVAALGDIYASLGRTAEAEKQYSLVEYIGLISKINREIYNRQIALFYADHNRKLDEALRLVKNEIAIRKDVYGYDALAWCLYKNGKTAEAKSAIHQALRLQTKDAKLFFHAGMIYQKSQPAAARRYLRAALDTNPYFHPIFSKDARETLRNLQ
jgi:tetratricopeptide (TPR) repeat protein